MNFANLMQQAQQMQRKVNKAKKTFNEKEFDFASQNNIISGKIKGDFEITELHIDQSMMNQESKEDVEALLIVTLNQKMKEIEKEREDTLNKITNGVDVSAFL
ncbi:MAG: YbaB/EbfC family nucleoid-associated protein [Longibaculum sp.]